MHFKPYSQEIRSDKIVEQILRHWLGDYAIQNAKQSQTLRLQLAVIFRKQKRYKKKKKVKISNKKNLKTKKIRNEVFTQKKML